MRKNLIITRSDWLRSRGGRRESDVFTDENGDYVLMNNGHYLQDKVYLPDKYQSKNDNKNSIRK